MKHLLFLFMILNASALLGQEVTAEEIIDGFRRGDLIVVNDLAIANADTSFFNKLARLEITEYEVLDQERGKSQYGTLGSKGVIRMKVTNTAALSKEHIRVVDATILSRFNEEDKYYYVTDGVRNLDIYHAISPLMNKKVENIEFMEAREAVARYGSAASRGALVITIAPGRLQIHD